MQELLLTSGGKKPIIPSDTVLLHFDTLPFVEEGGKTVTNNGVNQVEGKFENGMRVSSSTQSKLTILAEETSINSAFTMEMWLRKAVSGTMPLNQYLALIYSSLVGQGIGFQYYSNQYYLYDTSGTIKWQGEPGGLAANQLWKHHAICYNEGVYTFWIEGILKAQFNGENRFPPNSQVEITIGNHRSLLVPSHGVDFDEFLLTPGVAKYQTPFTPPETPFSN